MTQDFRIDSHKLIFHVGRVSEWLKGKLIAPIYLEIAPAGSCNHRCIFCAVDYLNYRTQFLDLSKLKSALTQAASSGVKSVMYAGEGEPLLHKDIAEIIRFTKSKGIDPAVTTNGVLLKKGLADKILKYLSWIRVSLNAGTEETYKKIHRCSSGDFRKVLENLKDAVLIKKKRGLDVVIGVQLLLIPMNVREVLTLAKLMKKIGVDYLTIKPYSQHPLSGSRIDPHFKYENYMALKESLEKLNDEQFEVIFREDTMHRLTHAKDYKRCLGLPFWAYIDACGDVYACSAFLGKKEFCYGNIYKTDFKKILYGSRRKRIIRRVVSSLDVEKCREVCRLDKINSYLWELKNPGKHVNFI